MTPPSMASRTCSGMYSWVFAAAHDPKMPPAPAKNPQAHSGWIGAAPARGSTKQYVSNPTAERMTAYGIVAAGTTYIGSRWNVTRIGTIRKAPPRPSAEEITPTAAPIVNSVQRLSVQVWFRYPRV